MKRINLNISDEIYQQLGESAKTNGQSKTYIIETALKQYLGSCADESTSMQIKPNLANLKTNDRATEEIEDILDRLKLLEENQRDHAERLAMATEHTEIEKKYPTERLLKLINENDARITRLEDDFTEERKKQKQIEANSKENKRQIDKLWIQKASINHWRNLEAKLEKITSNDAVISSDDSTEDNKPQQSEPSESSDEPQQGITQGELAKILGVHSSEITYWKENQASRPRAGDKKKQAFEDWKNWELRGEKWYPKTK